MGLRGFFGLERVQVANAVAAKTPVKAGATRLRAQEFAGHGQQVVLGQQQHLSEFDHDLFLCGRECGLKPVRGVQSVLKAVSALPFVDGCLSNAKALRQRDHTVGAGRNLGPDGGRGACVFCAGQSS